jgi:hypothetical protein
MNNADEIEKQMKSADQAAGQKKLDKDVAEIKGSNFGKMKKADIAIEKAKLSDTATKGTGVVAQLAEKFADNPDGMMEAGAVAGGLYLLHRFNRNRKARKAGEITQASEQAAAALSIQKVFVTNWPGIPGQAAADVVSTQPGGESKKAGKMARLGKALGAVGSVAAGWDIGYNVLGPIANDIVNAITSGLTGKEDNTLGAAIYDLLHKEQERAIEVKLNIDGRQVTEVINGRNSAQARRQ